jgi:magnesium transporter
MLSNPLLHDPVLPHIRRDVVTLHPAQTVAETLVALRRQSLAEKIIYFYVIDDQDRLCGVVPTRRLLMSQPEVTIATLMVKNLVTLPATATILDACEFFTLYRFLALPVVDEQHRLLGVVDVDFFTEEIFDLAEIKSTDALFQIIGVHVAKARLGSAWAGFLSRFPWLLANIGGGILCALVAGFYEAFLDQVIVLALFIPVVLALAESVSVQAATLTIQGFVGSRVDWRRFLPELGKEFITASLLGLACGGMVALVAWAWKDQTLVAFAIWGSITLSMVTACLLGAIMPTVIHSIGGDPKIAAGPLVLATTDIATLLFYFSLAALLLG